MREGGGIQNETGRTATITGSLIWNNVASDADEYDLKDNGDMTVNYSAVESGTGYTGSNNVTSITGNVFDTVGTPASFNNPQTDGDFYLLSTAAEIIDSADPSSTVDEDIDDHSRPIDGVAPWDGAVNDMGADEYGSSP